MTEETLAAVEGTEPEVSEPATEEIEEATQSEEPEPADQVSELPEGKSKQDAAFAQMRRDNEQLSKDNEAAQQRVAELEEQLAQMENAAKVRQNAYAQISGDDYDESIINQAIADAYGTSVEEVEAAIDKAEGEAKAARIQAEVLAERDYYKELAEQTFAEKQFAADIQEIRKAYPEESAGIDTFEQLDEKIGRYLKGSDMSAVEAFGTYLTVKARTEPKPAQEIGKVGKTPADATFLTREQVMAMSDAEQAANADLILRSSQKWK